MQIPALKGPKSREERPADAAEQDLTKLALETALTRLPASLRHTLAILDGCSRNLAELTLASLPLGSRLKLARYGLISTDEEQPGKELRLTKRGRKAIKLCGPRRYELDQDLQAMAARTAEALRAMPDDSVATDTTAESASAAAPQASEADESEMAGA